MSTGSTWKPPATTLSGTSQRSTSTPASTTEAPKYSRHKLVVMIASVHIVDRGRLATIRSLARKPKPGVVPGLRAAEVAMLVPLALSGPPPIGRAGLISFWDDEAAIDRFVTTDPIGRRFSGGLHA